MTVIRKQHFFEHHIRKVLLEVCPERNITQQARAQLNELLIITSKIIMNKTGFILISTKKKTISTVEIESAVKLVFSGQLAQKLTEEGNKCLQHFLLNEKSNNLKGQSRNSKADMLIPPSILEKIMRSDIGQNSFRIAHGAPIFLAGVIEYFLSQILDTANNVWSTSVSDNSKVRITIFDIEYGVRMDTEINHFFVSNNIYLFGSGNIPYIHPNLKDKDGGNDVKSLKTISKIQEEEGYVFPKSVFEGKIKNYISLVYPEIRYQKDCFSLFHDFIERFMVDILKHSNNITLHSGRNRVTANDIELVMSIVEKRIPEFLKKETINDDEEITFFDE